MASTSDFKDIAFPNKIAFGAQGGPRFKTSVSVTRGGWEIRNKNWVKARRQWNVAHGIKTQAEYDELVAFFYVVSGQAFGFRYKDWTDYKQNMVDDTIPTYVATGDGSTTSFQLIKRYTVGDQYYDRTITRPVPGTVRIYLSRDTDDLIENTTDWNIDHDTGLITFDVTQPLDPVEEIWATFEFDVPARFESDAAEISHSDYNNYNWPDINITEIRE